MGELDGASLLILEALIGTGKPFWTITSGDY